MDLKQLGERVTAAKNPEEAKIETVPNEGAAILYSARFTCPEFTSLCPVTGQPDFAHIIIDYVPKDRLIESKSLKLFLQSFRNHGAFHEACTGLIGTRLWAACTPHFIRVASFFYPRGGIPIDVFWSMGELPKYVHLQPIQTPEYRGRG